ncbi:hypothetical protein SISNIDRAFT_546881 [Sistotremastrum niveocremeum HHB9708]|uniref:Uncharacterized protein n=2 Tax=Sistotremastraceae TaxID=3402574 RepID=A0A164ZLE7_9AGAM|nr:hypothetical protein SISNIDRAFT_546881 [Sistotremastrum niveocremeum HHB9708]KZT42960.1 hypothetical protein SISSUDRAFT_1125206 [Sistotremastrum suecicum HHB10207 ss-3]
MRSQRATTLVLTGLAALANAALALHLISYSRSLRWDSQDAEWESSYDPISIRLDAVKLVWAILSIHFSLAALACIIGFFGALKRNPAWVRLYRDYSVADLSFSAITTLLFALASFRPAVRAAACEELSRQPDLMRELAETGLDLENCEPWIERAVLAFAGVMAVVLVVRLQFTLAVSSLHSQLVRSQNRRSLEDCESDSDAAPQRIYLLPARRQTPPTDSDVLVYAPVPLSSLSVEETRDLDATEAWVTPPPRHHHHHRRSSSASRSPSRHHHQHRRSASGRIRLPATPDEPLLPRYTEDKTAI